MCNLEQMGQYIRSALAVGSSATTISSESGEQTQQCIQSKKRSDMQSRFRGGCRHLATGQFDLQDALGTDRSSLAKPDIFALP